MEKNRRNLLITIALLVVVVAGAYGIYQLVVSRSSGPTTSYVPQLTLPADVSVAPVVSTPPVQSAVVVEEVKGTQDIAMVDPVQEVPVVPPTQTDEPVQPPALEEATETAAIEEPVSAPTVPDLPLTMLDGTLTSFSAVQDGKPVVMTFWATWCPSCKMEMTVMQKAWEQYGDDISFILLSTPDGQRETVEGIKSYVEKNNITAPVYWDIGYFSYVFGVNAIPVTVFINADGTLSHGYMGYIPEEAMLQEIRGLLD